MAPRALQKHLFHSYTSLSYEFSTIKKGKNVKMAAEGSFGNE
jgi:hypothetical protein